MWKITSLFQDKCLFLIKSSFHAKQLRQDIKYQGSVSHNNSIMKRVFGCTYFNAQSIKLLSFFSNCDIDSREEAFQNR